VQIRGVNRAGTEAACIQGWGIFDGPHDQASIDAIKTFKVNAVRLPLNEDCWLSINGAPGQYSGDAYKQAIVEIVELLEKNDLLAILDLHWTAPGDAAATEQRPMPDADHALAFWGDVASTLGSHDNVIFEPFNEPYPDSNTDSDAAWECWQKGGSCPGVGYESAGMQAIVDSIRNTGAKNVILLGGVTYSNSLSQWLAHMPDDPEKNLGAAWHIYNFNACADAGCWDSNGAPVLAKVPVVATEIGENDCDGAFIEPLMSWLDAHGGGYVAWTWDTWGYCLDLIQSYDGKPTKYGQAYKDHLAKF
jgi:hypothetical protein